MKEFVRKLEYLQHIQMSQDTERLDSITEMIDKWSVAYSLMIVLVSIIQLVVLRWVIN